LRNDADSSCSLMAAAWITPNWPAVLIYGKRDRCSDRLSPIMNGLHFENIPKWGGCGHLKRWQLKTTLLGGNRTTLVFSNINSLSSEEARIDRPDSRAKHRQGGTESGKHDAITEVTRSRQHRP
jgi:hypothetical protein